MNPSIHEALDTIAQVAGVIRIGLEVVAILVITVGAIGAIAQLFGAARARTHVSFNEIRLFLARYLALALEFQLAADIVETSITPDWQDLGQLAVIATIRTTLNYFLAREMREEREVKGRTSQPAEA